MKAPSYRRKTGRDYGFIEWRGVRHRLPGAYDSAESREAYRQFLSSRVFGSAQQQTTQAISVAAVFDRFLDFAREYYEPGLTSWEFKNLQGTLVPIGKQFGHLPIAEFGPLVLKEVQKFLVAAGHARTFVNTEISRVRRAIRWGVSEELVKPEVLQGLMSVQPLRAGHTVAQDRARRQPVEWEVVVATMAYCSSTIADMIAIQWYTGVRSDSLCRMERDQIDTYCDPWCWAPRHKTEHLGNEVIIPIGPQCRRVLERRIDRDGVIFRPRDSRANRIYRGTYNTNSYSQHIYRAQVRAAAAGHGLPHWHPHQLRHSREQIVEKAFGPEGARAALAHATLDATQIYSHRDLELAKRIAVQLG